MLPDGIKPCIAIYVFTHQGCENKLREVEAGMEEEGIPYFIVHSLEADAVTLAHQAACASKLGVGVGIGEEGLFIQYDKLPATEPLFTLKAAGTPADWRHFGYNAARLVKGIPFKERYLSEINPQSQELEPLYQLVRRIVQNILHETGQGHGEVKTWSNIR